MTNNRTNEAGPCYPEPALFGLSAHQAAYGMHRLIPRQPADELWRPIRSALGRNQISILLGNRAVEELKRGLRGGDRFHYSSW